MPEDNDSLKKPCDIDKRKKDAPVLMLRGSVDPRMAYILIGFVGFVVGILMGAIWYLFPFTSEEMSALLTGAIGSVFFIVVASILVFMVNRRRTKI